MQEKPYYLGLDMGTNSVGWAVTDQHYNLLKAKGKDLWGIREFIEADTSVERRTHRISRRRRQREQARIGLLNDYFHDAIIAIDPSFFQRLENSKYHLEDKDQKDENTDWAKVIEHADESGTIRSKKMYLYLTQKGRCMYTGNHIELSDLFNDNLYDIDHIYPVVADVLQTNIRNNKPEEGLVQVLRVTEKQYSKMEYIVGENHSQVLNNDERLVIL